jgi:hypothetical protein
MQVAFALNGLPTVALVDDEELKAWRINRLHAAEKKLTKGNRTAFGKLLGYKDGSYVRQMVRGKRAITEKLIRDIEAMRGMRGWFSASQEDSELVAQIRAELRAREIPEDTLRGILQIVQGCPARRSGESEKVAAVRAESMSTAIDPTAAPVADATEL